MHWGMGRGYLNLSGMRFDFSSPLGMCSVMSKYMRVGYGDGEDKTRPHPAPLPCLFIPNYYSSIDVRRIVCIVSCVILFNCLFLFQKENCLLLFVSLHIFVI